MKLHTTPNRIESQLNTTCSFSSDSIPSINTVNIWIREVSDYLNELTEHKYNKDEKEDILDWHGESDILLTSHSPIRDVVVYFNNAGVREAPNWVLLDEYINYLVDENKGNIILQFGGNKTANYKVGRSRFKVQYTSGTEDTPYWLQNLATRMVVRNVLESTINARANSTSGSQIRVGAVSVINPADYGVTNFRELKDGIEKELDSLKSMSRGVRYVNYK
jgi:hypothetical protein